MTKRYTTEQVEFLKGIVPGKKISEVTRLFNTKYNENKTIVQIKELCKRKKIGSGLDLSFKNGCQRTNDIISRKSNPIGTERVTNDGYIKIKIDESPSVWKLKQVVVWEEYYGKIPNGYVVTFLDRNRKNCSIDNLKLIHKRYLSRLNRTKLEYYDENSLKSCCLIADIRTKINIVSKNNETS